MVTTRAFSVQCTVFIVQTDIHDIVHCQLFELILDKLYFQIAGIILIVLTILLAGTI